MKGRCPGCVCQGAVHHAIQGVFQGAVEIAFGTCGVRVLYWSWWIWICEQFVHLRCQILVKRFCIKSEIVYILSGSAVNLTYSLWIHVSSMQLESRVCVTYYVGLCSGEADTRLSGLLQSQMLAAEFISFAASDGHSITGRSLRWRSTTHVHWAMLLH